MKKHDADDIIARFSSDEAQYSACYGGDAMHICKALMVIARILAGILGAITQQSKIIVRRS